MTSVFWLFLRMASPEARARLFRKREWKNREKQQKTAQKKYKLLSIS